MIWLVKGIRQCKVSHTCTSTNFYLVAAALAGSVGNAAHNKR